jgi:hypothetical protein
MRCLPICDDDTHDIKKDEGTAQRILNVTTRDNYTATTRLRMKLTLLYTAILSVEGFRIQHPSPRFYKATSTHFCSNYDIEAASDKMVWETLEESSSRPLLNLSSRDMTSPEDVVSETTDTSEWDQGQLWQITKQGLSNMGVEDTESVLQKCPQLLRLEPSMVLETAEWVVQEFSTKYLESEPRLLSFRLTDASYGLEFMSMMMMMDAKPFCTAAPELLLTGIEGGIQEQAVKKALGSAADATTKASQTIAGDTMKTFKNLQKQRRKGL